jgi:cold shock CspA family protein
MIGEYSYGRRQKAPGRSISVPAPLRQTDRRGTPTTGRIVKLLVGQGHGFIRASAEREVYFHRADLQDGTSINDLDVGDTVEFELLDDRVSGARALRLRRHQRRP